MASPLSELAKFDDLRRCFSVLYDGGAEEAYLGFVRNLETTREQWQLAVDSNMRLQRELEAAMRSMADLESKLNNARKLLELESKARREAEHERDALEKKLYLVKDLLGSDNNIKDETRSKLDFLNKMHNRNRKSARMSALEEQISMDINSTGSILSDLSLTRSENDFLDKSTTKRRWRKSKSLAAEGGTPRTSKHQQSNTQKIVHHIGNEKIVALTKVSVPQDDGPIMAESQVEAVPMQLPEYKTPMKSPKKRVQPSAPPMETPVRMTNRGRPHDFEEKTCFRTQVCNHCQKTIRFGQVGLRCKSCNIYCHPDMCRKNLDIVCAPQSAQKAQMYGKLADYVTPWKPMIPALLIHCVNEIEKRGLNEKGLYRVNGNDREIKALKEKFLRSKTVPCLREVDINVLCGCVKDFLRSLQDKLVPDIMWTEFSNSVNLPHSEDIEKTLKKLIHALPEANRDTLAFMMIHFQRISDSPEVKMPVDNLAKIFAPTLIGSSLTHQNENQIFQEAMIQVTILRNLLSIQQKFWTQLTNPGSTSEEPDTECYMTTNPETPTIFKSIKRKKRFYDTPPYNKKK